VSPCTGDQIVSSRAEEQVLMKIGLVGYQGSGKSTVFEWLTGVKADPALAHAAQSAMAVVPDARIRRLVEIYHPKKIVLASLELVDAAGLNRSHEGSAARLAAIREVGCLVLVVAAFARRANALGDVDSLDEDFLLADLEIVSGRIERLRESTKKGRPNRDAELAELSALEPALAALESGTPLVAAGMNEHQLKATRSFRLLTEKPKFVLVNVADDEADPDRFVRALAERKPPVAAAAAPVGLELELLRMSPQDREAFRAEMALATFDRDALVRTLVDVSGQILFFTASEKEVRSWLLPRGGTALDAADGIHSDLARGFIRAEVMHSDDLIRLGSEREMKAQGLVRAEPKDYVVRDGDILHIRFSV
jgi:ribosome-binding ATPase YchF (GTP1/OBG family)